jgi:hypothetical protein
MRLLILARALSAHFFFAIVLSAAPKTIRVTVAQVRKNELQSVRRLDNDFQIQHSSYQADVHGDAENGRILPRLPMETELVRRQTI